MRRPRPSAPKTHARRIAAGTLALLIASMFTACGVRIPVDPDGTLDRIRSSGVMRAGASPAGDALTVDAGVPRGPLVDIVERFARGEGARVQWTVGGEQALVEGLEAGEIDVVAGAMTDDTPWVDRASVTRAYTGIDGAQGRPLVFLMPLGENGLQSALEEFLDEDVGS